MITKKTTEEINELWASAFGTPEQDSEWNQVWVLESDIINFIEMQRDEDCVCECHTE